MFLIVDIADFTPKWYHKKMKRGVAVLGATGSVGRNALAVVDSLRERFSIVGLTANANAAKLGELVERYRPKYAALAEMGNTGGLGPNIPPETEVLEGMEGVIRVASAPEADIVLSAIVGAAGLAPAIAALEAGKTVALANKEPLVMAGGIITEIARKNNATLLPVDSEHNAIFQCLCGNRDHDVHKIVLTASGGPFYGESPETLENVTPEQALNHPTWDMGAKISIDSATLMNKGLEVIEAQWLFGVDIDKIEVVIHPSSVVHSMVEFADGSIIAQLGKTDMRLPIQYALTYPERVETSVERLSITDVSPLEFFKPSFEKFPCLRLAYEAARAGGTMPAVLNAANEVAVEEFLGRRLGFGDIPRLIEDVMQKHAATGETPPGELTLEDVLVADKWARECAMGFRGSIR
jgi:1-deoxy-D-xylulose-5-phosphate reductoisomerase